MSDRRRTPANTRVALSSLRGTHDGVAFTEGTHAQIAVPFADLCAAPNGARDRQCLYGEAVTVIETRDGWSFVQAAKDDYVGYLHESALIPARTPTHWLSAPASHLYEAPDFKSRDRVALSFGSHLTVTGISGRFLETPDGFIPSVHARPLSETASDPAAIAELFLGTPYLWGGNSRFGIDCSGLVQAALIACGLPCPGDSDMQEAEIGIPLPTGTSPRRNDLLFWKGHVALILDDTTLIHANAHHMAVASEDIASAITRIQDQGDGPVTAHKRL
ncbi:MAG: C40 family peptidase [Rhodobacteraceae bacterium]|nr:C40 family peptidase [Paracoccaceae bacterium]